MLAALPRDAGTTVAWTADCEADDLLGATISIVGLEHGLTDVLVVLELDGLSVQRILTPERPSMIVEPDRSEEK